MLRSCIASRALTLIVLVVASLGARADSRDAASAPPGIAVEDFAYIDTSGEPTDQTETHRKQLQSFMSALRRDIETDGKYRMVALACGMPCADVPTAELLRTGTKAGAKIVVFGAVHKMSTLVQWAKVQAIDVEAHRIVLEKLFTFRGDDGQAWDRAEVFISREVRAGLAADSALQIASKDAAIDNRQDGPESQAPAAAAESAAPIRLAMFNFELEDTSASAALEPADPRDEQKVARVTDRVRQLLAQSGRYSLVDVSGVKAPAAKAHTLHECDGCEARIARDLGADESFVGVIARISRTEYTVRFQIRDARTNALVLDGDSGLRMGADYSWDRGAVRLIEDRLQQSEHR